MTDDKPKKSAALSQRIDPQMKADLEELARREERSVANYIQQVLRRHIEEAKRSRPNDR